MNLLMQDVNNRANWSIWESAQFSVNLKLI